MLIDAGGSYPMLVGNVCFGLVFASYGVVPKLLLPVAMLLSGVFSALMLAPNLLLISDLVRRGYGEGLFGAFQVAGSFGFLTGPIVGGIWSPSRATPPDGPRTSGSSRAPWRGSIGDPQPIRLDGSESGGAVGQRYLDLRRR